MNTINPALVEVGVPRDGVLSVDLRGDWASSDDSVSIASSVLIDAVNRITDRCFDDEVVARIELSGNNIIAWDSRIMVAITAVWKIAKQHNLRLGLTGLPAGIQGLLHLSLAVPPRGERRTAKASTNFLDLIGNSFINLKRSLSDANIFLGLSMLSLWQFTRGKARFQRADIWHFIEVTGPQALPIVGLINILLGIILGFMGAVQLRQFGAEIYVADLVALGQTREIAPMMTGIVMAGRTGAAYAAQLGTMQVNEEIDALKTFGFSPMNFLVLPRMLALALMFPVLVLYADALGILGGYIVGVGILDISTAEYIEQTRGAIGLSDIALGLVKGSIFGILVAITGCMHGMQSGRSASAVGDAATNAVVSGIIAIIVMTAVFAVLTNILNI